MQDFLPRFYPSNLPVFQSRKKRKDFAQILLYDKNLDVCQSVFNSHQFCFHFRLSLCYSGGQVYIYISIHGNDGKIEGKSKRDKGVIDKAIVLEPQTWIDLNGPEFKNVPLEGITIAVWVNHNDSPDPQSIFDSIGTDHGSGLYHVEIRPAGFRFFHRDGAEKQVFNINPGPIIKGGKWVHFTGTYDSKSGDTKTYIDGKVTHEAKGDGKLSDNWGVQAEIGHHKNSRWFDGLMDEFYMFARALSKDEIKEVMDGELLSVKPADKLTTTWGSLKARR